MYFVLGGILLLTCVTVEVSARSVQPQVIQEGNQIIHQYPHHRMEVIMKVKATEAMVATAEEAIERYYRPENEQDTGRQAELIAEVMETKYGGYWMVSLFDDPFMWAASEMRRSPAFIHFNIDEKGVLIAKQA